MWPDPTHKNTATSLCAYRYQKNNAILENYETFSYEWFALSGSSTCTF